MQTTRSDEWKNLVAAGHDREELIVQMQKAHGEFYGKVDKIRIIINPAKFKDSGGGRALAIGVGIFTLPQLKITAY